MRGHDDKLLQDLALKKTISENFMLR